MENASYIHKHRMTAVPSGIAFGAAGSLFSNLGISLSIFCINMVYGLLLPRYFADSTPSVWVTDVIPLVFIVIISILFIWAGVRTTAWIFKKRGVVSVAHKLPLFAVGFFFLPTLFWVLVRILGDLTGSGSIGWLPLGYLLAQGLIFGGALYFFLEQHRRKLVHEESVLAPLIAQNHRAHCFAAGFFAFLFSGALLVKLHALEIVFSGTERPILLLGGNNPVSDITFLLVVCGIELISLLALIGLRKNRSPKAILASLKMFSTYEYLFAALAASSGVLTAVSFAAQIDFMFTPYTTLISTTAVLLGLVFSAVRYAEGKRDGLFVSSRTVAYLVGFFGQPTVLGTILAVLKQITG